MQMTGYELLANYEKAEDKDKQIQILADLNHIPVDMVCFVIDNSEKFDVSETPLSAEEFAKWCETELDVWMLISMHRKNITEKFATYTESQVHTGKGVRISEQRIS